MTKFYKAFIPLLSIITLAYSQDQNIKFEKISIEQGLSQSTVRQIVQDQQGFLWFGTNSGLNRYDGYNFKVYYAVPGDTNSLSNNYIECLFVDRKNILWIGTSDGLNAYDIKNDKFTHFRNDLYNPTSISDNKIFSICEDGNENLWIGTNNGLNKYDKKKNVFIHYYYSDQIPDNFYNIIRCALVDRENNIWFGTYNGLYLISADDLKKDTPGNHNIASKSFRHLPLVKTYRGGDIVNELYEDRSGIIWIGTVARGLIRYDKNSDILTRLKSQLNNGEVISNIDVRSMCQDRSGTLWVGTNMGLFIFDKEKEKIIYKDLEGKAITHIFEDQSGVIWISVKNEGLRKYDRENQQFPPPLDHGKNAVLIDKNGDLWLGDPDGIYKRNRITHQFTKFKLNPHRTNPINAIHEDSKGRLWIGSRDLYKLDRNKNQFEIIDIDYNHSKNLPVSDLTGEIFKTCYFIYEDKKSILWIGAQTGLYKYNNDTKVLFRYSYDASNSEGLSNNTATVIYEDTHSNLWVGTALGLNKFDPISETFTRFSRDHSNPYSISDNTIYDIYESRFEINGPLWIATNGGLNRLDRGNEVFKHYTINDGLPHNGVLSILEDDHGNLWLSTRNGLSKFNPTTGTFKNFYKSDGLQDNAFGLSAFQNKKGEMFFSGPFGLSVFHPDSIIDDPHVPPIVITGFKKFNKEVKLDTAISHIKQIRLTYDEKVISFEFAALNYTNPQKNQFAYMMAGFDRDWIYSGYRHDVTYTNLTSGEYVFKVKGSNHDGVWNEDGTSLRITITPPWWHTNLAYVLYILLIGSIIYGTWRFKVNRLRLKHELEMEHLHAEKLQEMDHIKSRFFANISHEFRTPLTLILGPIEKWRKIIKEKRLKQDLDLMRRNADRLHRLINQLLDLSKLEAGGMSLQTRCMDIVQHVKELTMSFTSHAERKQIILKFKAKDKSVFGYFDCDKLEKIVTNLLSNAFKFTPQGGEIRVTVKVPNSKHQITNKSPIPNPQFQIPNSDFVEITITNTGPGIPADRLNKIFDRFYQLDDSFTREHEGTGIGLALTRELVKIHHGEIWVESIPNEKTTFTLQLPLGKDHLKEEEIVEDLEAGDRKLETGAQVSSSRTRENDARYQIPDSEDQPELSYQSSVSGLRSPVSGLQSPLILIVEDNADMRRYIRDRLENDYRIFETDNGENGLMIAVDKVPDLIISDVMMPKMDGFELCRKLKTDERTSHIPVVLLTARAESKDKIEGLETGADDYIAKPFDADELEVRIKNLIEQRRKLRERFLSNARIQSKEIAVTSMDDKFIKRSIGIIEDHLSDMEFSVAQFSREIGISRSQLHRKIHALTNHSVSQFICLIKLQRAIQLLEKNAGTVAEIAYRVGFNSPSYFNRCFHDHFNMSPLNYISRQSIRS